MCVLAAARAPQALLPIAALMAGVPTVATSLLLLEPARATDDAIAQSGGTPPEQSAIDLWAGTAGMAVSWVGFAAVDVGIASWLLVRGRAPGLARGFSNAGTSALLVSFIPTLGGTLAPAVVGAAIAFAATRVDAAYGREHERARRSGGGVASGTW